MNLPRLLLTVAAMALLPACAAQVVSRTQQAVNATQNTADAVIAQCNAPALTPGQSTPTAGLPPDQAAAQQAAIDARDAANLVTPAIAAFQRANAALEEFNKIKPLVLGLPEMLQQLIRTREQLDTLFWDFYSLPGTPGIKPRRSPSEMSLVTPDLFNLTHSLANQLVLILNTMEKSSSIFSFPPPQNIGWRPLDAAEMRAIAVQIQSEADHPHPTTATYAFGALPIDFPLDVPAIQNHLRSVVELSLSVRLDRNYLQARLDQLEKDLALRRGNARAQLQTALDAAKAATAAADALVQKCGGQPITTRLPGYSETFWDISS